MQSSMAQSSRMEINIRSDEQLGASTTTTAVTAALGNETDEANSDYIQWLHAMKLVARLPGGMPPEFRRKVI